MTEGRKTTFAVFILLDPSLAASAPVNTPVLTHYSFPSGSMIGRFRTSIPQMI
ncbi:hypothetical protein [Lysinibacillus sphaericus]|uniref:hypothetical protein n=1 Tax=Lysinibacillus sphaericus TaxID=1421 RepID=UPI00163BA3F8|nr:hypothetical protein [Lysinibacillus sp. SDF0037]